MQNNNTKQNKNFFKINYFSLVYLSIFLAGIFISYYIYLLVDRQSKESVINRSETISVALNKNVIENLNGNEKDLSNNVYLNLKEYFINVKNKNEDIKFISLLRFDALGKFYFLADSEISSSKDYSPPGQIYTEVPKEISNIIYNKHPRAFYYTDRWGTFLGGYVPVLDNANNIIAVLGIDILAAQQKWANLLFASIPFLTAIFMCVFIFITRIYISHKEKREDIIEKIEFINKAEKDISKPLVYIRAQIENILQSENVNEKQKIVFTEIYKQTFKVVSGVENLLGIFLLKEKGNGIVNKKNFEKVNLYNFLNETKDSMYIISADKDIKINIDKSVGQNLEINIHKNNLQNIINKLLKNIIYNTKFNSEILISYANLENNNLINFADEGFAFDDEIIYLINNTENIYNKNYMNMFNKNDIALDFYLLKNNIENLGGKLVYFYINNKNHFSIYLPE